MAVDPLPRFPTLCSHMNESELKTSHRASSSLEPLRTKKKLVPVRSWEAKGMPGSFDASGYPINAVALKESFC